MPVSVRWFVRSVLRPPYPAPHGASASAPIRVQRKPVSQLVQHVGVGAGESIGQHGGPVDILGSGHAYFLCSRDFGRSLEESRDDRHSSGFDTPDLTRSYTSLADATQGG
jgi:hypothetical protein